jgi:molecular chaperone DnaK
VLRRDLAELRNQAETLVYTTEQALDGYGDLLDAAVLDEVRLECAELRRLLDAGGDLTALKDSYARLEGAAFRIAESIYGEQEPPGDAMVG